MLYWLVVLFCVFCSDLCDLFAAVHVSLIYIEFVDVCWLLCEVDVCIAGCCFPEFEVAVQQSIRGNCCFGKV